MRNFLLLKDWRENHEFYHKIGYLIASGYKNLSDIYAEAQGKSKKKFLARLDELIRASVKLDGGKNYSDWNYNEDAEKIRRLLLLFNVESVRQNGEQSQWFPFDKYKFGGEKNSWSWNTFTRSIRRTEATGSSGANGSDFIGRRRKISPTKNFSPRPTSYSR